MRWVMAAALALSAGALSACAAGTEKKAATAAPATSGEKAVSDCAETDWVSIGQRDGLYGEAAEKLDERAAECRGTLLASHREDYQRGRARGLKTYCTPDAGFDAGRNGREYRGLCPAETEPAFLVEYQSGRRLYDLNQRVANTKTALATAVSTVESDRFELKRALTRVSDMNATPEEKSRAMENVDRYRRNIGRLEDDIPKLEAAIVDAETALKAYRAGLKE
jgi:hypothetical protein